MDGTQTERLTRQLNIIDNLRTLSRNSNVVQFQETLDDNIPQIVVVGMTNVGKSSLLGRLGNIHFPSANQLCTVVRAELRLRRKPEERSACRLCGKGLDKAGMDFMDRSTGRNMTEAIRLAQEEAKRRVGKPDTISNDYWIEIDVEGPDRINVTLVDLPGLVAAEDHTSAASEYAKSVDKISLDAAARGRTIVLHIMPLNTSTKNLLSKSLVTELLAKHPKKQIISVFTKCDEGDNNEKKKVALDDYLELTKGQPRFAVKGDFEVEKEGKTEPELLNGLRIFENTGIQLGAKALGTFLEEKIGRYMEEVWPGLEAKFMAELGDVTAKYNRLAPPKDKDRHRIVYTMADALYKQWAEPLKVRKPYEKALRDLWETSRVAIRNCHLIFPTCGRVTDLQFNYFRKAEISELRRGDLVLVKDAEDLNINELSEVHPSLCVKVNGCDKFVQEVFVEDLEKTLACDAKTLVENRGLTNRVFDNKAELLSFYMERIKENLLPILIGTVNKVVAKAQRTVEQAFTAIEAEMPPCAEGVCMAFRRRMSEELDSLKKQAATFVERMSEWNQLPFIVDEEAFDDSTTSLSDELSTMRDLMELNGNVEIGSIDRAQKMLSKKGEFNHIERAWAIRRSVVIEALANELTLVFITDLSNCFQALKDRASEYVKYVVQPSGAASERKSLEASKKAWESAIAILRGPQLLHEEEEPHVH